MTAFACPRCHAPVEWPHARTPSGAELSKRCTCDKRVETADDVIGRAYWRDEPVLDDPCVKCKGWGMDKTPSPRWTTCEPCGGTGRDSIREQRAMGKSAAA